jgi:hypothetical protein
MLFESLNCRDCHYFNASSKHGAKRSASRRLSGGGAERKALQGPSGAAPPEAAGLTGIKVDYGTVAASGGHDAVVDCRWGAG